MNKKYKLKYLLLGLIMFGMTGCVDESINNPQYISYAIKDYDYAIIKLPDKRLVKGHIDSWYKYSSSEEIQVTIDGITYLINSKNAVLIQNWGE